jgi:hypothetical protein
LAFHSKGCVLGVSQLALADIATTHNDTSASIGCESAAFSVCLGKARDLNILNERWTLRILWKLRPPWRPREDTPDQSKYRCYIIPRQQHYREWLIWQPRLIRSTYTKRLIAAIDSRPNLVMSITLEAATVARTTFVAMCSVPGDASSMAEVLTWNAPFCPLSNDISVFLSS